jgi:hypothetical protein
MNMTRHTKDILTFENFITLEECAAAIKVLDKQMEEGKLSWTPISFYESYSSNLPQDNDPDLEEFGLPPTFFSDIEKKIIECVASVHDIDKNIVSKIGYHTQKWEPGAYATPHSDNTDIEGNSGPFERSRYAAFLYLNDDFEGGILKFVKQKLEIEPKAGMLAAFAGGFENIHEVTIIKKGVRYTIGSFWDDREESDYPEELREQWKQEMEKIRESQEKQKTEWQDAIKDGYKISKNGRKYKIEELD